MTVDVAEGVLVHVKHILAEDHEIEELSDLPLEWAAERASETDAWRRYPLSESA